MHVLLGCVFVAAVIALGVWVFSGVDRMRSRGSGQQSAETWYGRFADKRPHKRK